MQYPRQIRVDELVGRLPLLAGTLRSLGYTVGVGQVVEAARLLASYASLAGSEALGLDEASFVLASALGVPEDEVRRVLEPSLRRKALEVEEAAKRIEEEIWEAMRRAGVKPGERVSRKAVARRGGKRGRRERIAAYLDLKRAGVIKGPPGAERVASPGEIRGIAFRLASAGADSLRDALAGRRLGFDDLMLTIEARGRLSREDVEALSVKRLARLGEWARRTGNRAAFNIVAEELARRARQGARLDEDSFGILVESGLLTPSEEAALIAGGARVDPTRLSPEEVASLASRLPDEAAARLVAKALRSMKDPEQAWRLLERVDPGVLWDVGRTPLRGPEAVLVRAAADAARGVKEAISYLEGRGEGHGDMAAYLARKALEAVGSLPSSAGRGRLTAGAVEALASLALDLVAIGQGGVEADGRAIADTLAGLDYEQALRVLRGLYASGSGPLRDAAVAAAERLLEKLASTAGSRLLPKKVTARSRPGRVEVRSSTYRLLRMAQDPIVYKRRLSSRELTLVLDISGSMSKYSVWALATAMAFSRHVKDLVLFSAKASVLQGPLDRRRLATALLSARFEGLTDVGGALRAAATGRAKRVVVITDLKQTAPGPALHEVVADLRRRGYRLLFIVPPDHDPEARRLVEASGGVVRVAFTPVDAAREVLRALRR